MRNLSYTLISLILGFSMNAHALRVVTFQLVPPTSMSTNITSASHTLDQLTGCNIQAVWTGGVGTIDLQVSNDGTNFDSITGAIQNVSGAGHFTWNVPDAYFHLIRVVYSRASSTGTLTVTETDKGP